MMKYEKLEKLQNAQTKLFECIDLLEEACGDNANTKAYLIDHLKIFASDDHGFLTDDLNISKLMKQIESGDDCDCCDSRDCDDCSTEL